MLILWLDIGRVSEVDFDPFAHYFFPIKDLADPDCGILIKERYYDSAERLEWGPGMDRRRGINEVSNG